MNELASDTLSETHPDNQNYVSENPNDSGITVEYDCAFQVFMQQLEALLAKIKDE